MSYEVKYYSPCGSSAGHSMEDVLEAINAFLDDEYGSTIDEDTALSDIGVLFSSIDCDERYFIQIIADVIEKSLVYYVCDGSGGDATAVYKEVFPDYDTMYEDAMRWDFDMLYCEGKDHAPAEALILDDIDAFYAAERGELFHAYDETNINLLEDSYVDKSGESHAISVDLDVPAKIMFFLLDGNYASEWDYTSYETMHKDLWGFSYEGLYEIAVHEIEKRRVTE